MPALETTEQFLPLFDPNNEHYNKRYLTWHGGRGGRKSWEIARGLLMRGQREQKKILCTREFQNSIDDSVIAVLESQANKLGLQDFYEFQKTAIYGKNGTKFVFKGLRQNINSIKSFEDVDIVWNEEAQTTSQKSIDVLYPTIRKPGSQIITSYNTTYPTDPIYIETVLKHDPSESYLCHVTYLDNPHIDADFVRRADKIKASDYEAYSHIYLGEFDTRFSGSVYAKLVAKLNDNGRITDKVKHDPAHPVYVTWDLGYGDSTVLIFFQVGNGEVFIIDYYESNMEDIRYYAEVLYGKEIVIDERDLKTGEVMNWHFGEGQAEHIDAKRQAYKYHANYMPHDADYEVQAAAGRSILSQMRKFDINVFCIPSMEDRDRHEATWNTLPKCWINADNCTDLVSSMMHYHFPYDEELKRFGKKPVHDWSSHACSAMELLSRVWREKTPTTKELAVQEVNNRFHILRRENNLISEDPYRTKKAKR